MMILGNYFQEIVDMTWSLFTLNSLRSKAYSSFRHNFVLRWSIKNMIKRGSTFETLQTFEYVKVNDISH